MSSVLWVDSAGATHYKSPLPNPLHNPILTTRSSTRQKILRYLSPMDGLIRVRVDHQGADPCRRMIKMNKKTQSIQYLLSQARSGSRTDMERLASITWKRLYPFVFRLTWDHDLTEDIVQETLLAVVQEVNALRDTGRFWPWVHRIARNKIQDNLRRSRLQDSGKTILRDQSGETKTSGNILDVKIREEKLQKLRALIQQLSRQHRDVLHLRYYEQMPYTEIASMTRTTPEKARARFHRARKRLKAQLMEDTVQGITVGV